MTLATLLLIGASTILLHPGPRISLAPQDASTNSAASSPKQDQATPATPSSTAGGAQATPRNSAKPRPKRAHKKKSASSGCDRSASPSSAAPDSSASSTPSADQAGTTSGKASATSATPTNCPPPKIIVRQGGTAEPSIQLAGGPTADEAARKRDAINQMLGVTDQNLKKVAAHQLTSTQQETVTQAKQFMEQSKQAITDGDLERARTLAWKAQVLSEDLVDPEK